MSERARESVVGALLGAVPRASASRGGGRLPLDYLQPGPFQPRRTMAEGPLAELADSIRSTGVLQPIIARPRKSAGPDEPRYEIVAGERRWQAARLAGLTDIPVVVRELSDAEAVAVALIENIQREELTPAEEARTLGRLCGEFGLTHESLGRAIGRSRASVSNLIRLLDLPEPVLRMIDEKQLSMGHARALLALPEADSRIALARSIVERGASVRDAERMVQRARPAAGAPAEAGSRPRPVVRELLNVRGARVRLRERPGGASRIIVEISDPVRRDRLLEVIGELLVDE